MGATESAELESQKQRLRNEQLRADQMKAEKLLAEQTLEYERRNAAKIKEENSRLSEKLRAEQERAQRIHHQQFQADFALAKKLEAEQLLENERQRAAKLKEENSRLNEKLRADQQAALNTPRMCQNARFGCTFCVPERELLVHSHACFFRLLPCPLQPCSWHGNYNRLFNHAKDAHPAHLGINFGRPEAVPVARRIWMLHRGPHVFLLHSRGAPDAGSWACWTLQLLGPPEEAAHWKYEVTISKPQEPKMSVAISEMCIAEFEDVERVFEDARCAAIPLIVIRNYFNKNQVTLKLSAFNKSRNAADNAARK